MKLFSKSGASLLAVAALASVGTAHASVNLVTNGTFSMPDTTSSGYSTGQVVPGWTNLAETYVEVGQNGTYGLTCINSTCSNAEVNNNTYGEVEQTVSGLADGVTYFLSFDYGVRTQNGVPDAADMDVYFGGTLLDDVPSDLAPTPWTLVGAYVVGTGSPEVLEFQGLPVLGGFPDRGNEITNVSLVAVPEPASWVMMLAGFGLVGLALRSRAKVRVSFSR